ncbi:hypothetical protein AAVH_39050, partial [Aphelenchoides avenae]
MDKAMSTKSFSRVAIRPSDVQPLFETVIEADGERPDDSSPLTKTYTTQAEAFDAFVKYVKGAKVGHVDVNLVTLETEASRITEAQWTKLVDAVRSASVEKIEFKFVDFSDVRAAHFHKNLQAHHTGVLSMEHCVFNCFFITDAFFKKFASVHIAMNELRGGECLHVTEQGLIDFCFSKEEAAPDKPLELVLEGLYVSPSFCKRFIEKHLSSYSLQPFACRLSPIAVDMQKNLEPYATYESDEHEYIVPADVALLQVTLQMETSVMECRREPFD